METLPVFFPDWRILGVSTEPEADEIQRGQLLSLALLDEAVFPTPLACAALIQRWRASGVATPLAATTASRSISNLLWAAGADDVLIKPWDTIDLQHRLDRLMRLSTAGDDVVNDLLHVDRHR